MLNSITIEYKYAFRSGMDKKFTMVLDQATLALQFEKRPTPHLWANLNNKK